jgi:hypothetical protein
MQSFFGKINFVRKFIPDFTETIKPFQRIVRKDVDLNGTRKKGKIFIKLRRPFLKHLFYVVLIVSTKSHPQTVRG